MAQFPYTSNSNRLKSFIEKLRNASIPTKVTQKVLESLGFKSNNDRAFIGVLKSLQFLDSSGVPTESWRKFRDKSVSGSILAQAIKVCYSELFDLYPDAHRKDDEALHNFFSSNTTVGEGARKYMVITFKALCAMADFEAITNTAETAMTPIHPATPSGEAVAMTSVQHGSQRGVTININIELTMPATNDSKVYDAFFQSMKKHLLAEQKDE